MNIRKYLLPVSLFLTAACSQSNSTGDKAESATVSQTDSLNAPRNSIDKNPVAIYDVPLKDDLNNWHFKVSLYQTKQRFNYLLHMKYQEVAGSDTIRFPNFGTEPQPRIQKGKNDLECIIGFLDNTGKFREYVMVAVENDQLKLSTLKRYAVNEK